MANRVDTQSDRQAAESYSGADSEAALHLFAVRSAQQQAGFLLPHLRPGMDVLDCGCGSGTITAGLARAVMPGQVVGIDIDDNAVAKALAYAADEGIPNLRYETASVYELPFPNASFDAVYSNAVLTHLADPETALREQLRVLKSGGVAGARNYTVDGCVLSPEDPVLWRFVEILAALIEHNGGDAYLGKHQRALLRRAGFVNVRASASFDHYGTNELTAHLAGVVTAYLGEEKAEAQVIEFGLADRDEIDSICRAWLQWGESPDAFYASAYGEAVGWKA